MTKAFLGNYSFEYVVTAGRGTLIDHGAVLGVCAMCKIALDAFFEGHSLMVEVL